MGMKPEIIIDAKTGNATVIGNIYRWFKEESKMIESLVNAANNSGNKFFVVEKETKIVRACQETKEGATTYWHTDRILIEVVNAERHYFSPSEDYDDFCKHYGNYFTHEVHYRANEQRS